MTHAHNCEHCGQPRDARYALKVSPGYVSRLCLDCYRAGVRSPPEPRMQTPWQRDEHGILGRQVGGGA